MISYSPGSDSFDIVDESKLNPAQLNALSSMKDKGSHNQVAQELQNYSVMYYSML